MTDDIEAFFARAAMIQAIIHADKSPPEKSFDNFDDLMAWLLTSTECEPTGP